MEFHWIQWNSIGSNGIPLDPMEFHGEERIGAMMIDDGRRSRRLVYAGVDEMEGAMENIINKLINK